MGRSGPAGNLGEFHQYRLNREQSNQWLFRADAETIKEFTFQDLQANILNYTNSEVDNSCDSATSHYKNLMDRDEDNGLWKDWTEIRNYDGAEGLENPCFHTRIMSTTEYQVVHGSGPQEECTLPFSPEA